MTFDISDVSRLEILVDDGWRQWYIPKFRIELATSGDDVYLYWTDSERSTKGVRRLLVMNYNDVTFGYITPSAASEVVTVINQYIISAWTDIIDSTVTSVTDDGNGVVVVDNTIPSQPVVQFAGVNVDGVTVTGDGTAGNPLVSHSQFPIDIETVSGDYTLVLSDAYKFIQVDDSGGEVDVTVPAEASEDFEIGTTIELYSITTEPVNIVADTGVTINSINGYMTIDGQFGHVWLTKTGSDEWALYGDLDLTLDPDATAYIDAVGTLTDAQKLAVNDFVVGCKTDGTWAKLRACYPIIGGTASAHKWNLVDPQDTNGAFRLVFVGSPTHGATGITFNGSTQYADTFLVPTTHLTQDSTHICFTSRNTVNAGVQVGTLGTSSNQFDLIARISGSGFSDQYNGGTNRITSTQSDSIGTYLGSRTSSTVHKLFKNGTQTGATDTNASANWAGGTFSFYIGARNNNGTATTFSANELCFVSIGDGLSDAEVSAYNARITTLNSALGR